MPRNTLPFRLAGLIVVTLAIAPAQAKIVTLSFSGTYFVQNDVLGVQGQGEYVPYRYLLTYDTSLGSNDVHIASGVQLGDYITTHDWYGYSASGLIAADVHFGNQTWSVNDLTPRFPAAGISADLWFDTDLTQATPNLGWAYFETFTTDTYAALEIGGGLSDGKSVQLINSSFIYDQNGYAVSNDLHISAVPEPQALSLLPAGMAALCLFRKKRALH